MASTRSDSEFIPSVFTVYPKNVISLTPNTHFAELIVFVVLPFVFGGNQEIVDVCVYEI
jgi:hypothetical protein